MMTNNIPTYASPYEEKQSRLKNPIVLAAIICIGLIMAVIIISLIATKTGEVIAEKTKENLYSLLKEHYDEVALLEQSYTLQGDHQWVMIPKPTMTKEELENEIANNYKSIEGIKTLRKELDSYGGIKVTDQNGEEEILDEKIILIKKTINTKMPYYEKYAKLYEILANVYINDGDGGSITALQKYAQQENANELYENTENYYVLKNKVEETGCKTSVEGDCKKIMVQYQTAVIKASDYYAFAKAMKKVSAKYKTYDNILSTIDIILSYYPQEENAQ